MFVVLYNYTHFFSFVNSYMHIFVFFNIMKKYIAFALTYCII